MAKKVSKPAFVADVVDVNKPETWVHRINQAKIEAGLPISKRDYEDVIEACGVEGYDAGYADGYDNCEFVTSIKNLKVADKSTEKKSVVKRFWNWLTNKK